MCLILDKICKEDTLFLSDLTYLYELFKREDNIIVLFRKLRLHEIEITIDEEIWPIHQEFFNRYLEDPFTREETIKIFISWYKPT